MRERERERRGSKGEIKSDIRGRNLHAQRQTSGCEHRPCSCYSPIAIGSDPVVRYLCNLTLERRRERGG